MRLIDADALLWRVDKMLYAGRLQHTRDYIYAVNTQPTIDAEPVNHGRWIGDPDDYFDDLDDLDELQCSVCGAEFDNISNDVLGWNYCPHCGAKMDGGNDDGKTD